MGSAHDVIRSQGVPASGEIRVGEQSTKVLVEQLGVVDSSRLGEIVGHASPHEMWGIDEAILTVLGLS